MVRFEPHSHRCEAPIKFPHIIPIELHSEFTAFVTIHLKTFHTKATGSNYIVLDKQTHVAYQTGC